MKTPKDFHSRLEYGETTVGEHNITSITTFQSNKMVLIWMTESCDNCRSKRHWNIEYTLNCIFQQHRAIAPKTLEWFILTKKATFAMRMGIHYLKEKKKKRIMFLWERKYKVFEFKRFK